MHPNGQQFLNPGFRKEILDKPEHDMHRDNLENK